MHSDYSEGSFVFRELTPVDQDPIAPDVAFEVDREPVQPSANTGNEGLVGDREISELAEDVLDPEGIEEVTAPELRATREPSPFVPAAKYYTQHLGAIAAVDHSAARPTGTELVAANKRSEATAGTAIEVPQPQDVSPETDHKAPEAETPSKVTQLFSRAADLLVRPDETNNSYLADARGYLRLAEQQITSNTAADDKARADEVSKIALIVAEHAVDAGNTKLANHLFPHVALTKKWELYARAHETASVESDCLGKWRIGLEEVEITSARDRVDWSVARAVALAEIDLQNARTADGTEREALLKQARTHQRTAIMLGGDPKVNPDQKGYIQRLNLAFAKAESWDDIGPPPTQHKALTTRRLSQLAAKATAGELTGAEHKQLKKADRTGDVLRWINDARNGQDAPAPNVLHSPPDIQTMIEHLAPDLAEKLDRPSSSYADLRVKLTAGNYEAAENKYTAITQLRNPPDMLRAALAMSRHDQGLQAAAGAHGVFYQGFLSDLAQVEAGFAALKEDNGVAPEIKDVLRGQLKKLHFESGRLRGPAEALRADAHLVRAYTRFDPSGPYAYDAMARITAQWNTLEQRASNNTRLGEVASELQSLGFTFVKQWKPLPGGGYVGYTPCSPSIPQSLDPVEVKAVPVSRVHDWQKAAATLNHYLQEEQYYIKAIGEPRFTGEGKNGGLFEQRIEIGGPAMKFHGGFHALRQAHGHLQHYPNLPLISEYHNRVNQAFSIILT